MIQNLRARMREIRQMRRKASDAAAVGRYAFDLVSARLFKPTHPARLPEERQLRMRDGATLNYRVNSGDLQSIREVWLDEVYALPGDYVRSTIVDLGANIGLTSTWLAKRYGASRVLAVEPSRSNVRIARRNYSSNAVPAEVVEAAVGAVDGMARFQEHHCSNLGSVGPAGREVRSVSMWTILAMLPRGPVDLLKIDIEGGEQDLLTGSDLSWLGRVREIVIEFHPSLVDHLGLIARLESYGFVYHAPGSFPGQAMDYFRSSELGGAG